MTSKSVATALTLYRSRTLTLEQAATVGGCSTAQLEESARAFAPAPGEAPADLSTTGDPIFCSLWSLCGLPAITLPLLTGPNNMPVGVQVVGAYGQDARLLRTARWLLLQCSPDEETGQ